MSKVETGLTLKGNAEFGKQLLDAAASTHKEELQKKVVGYVQSMMKELEFYRSEEEAIEESMELIEGKLKAIQEGKFNLKKNGDVIFNDPDLQKNYRPSGSCRNCGMALPGFPR